MELVTGGLDQGTACKQQSSLHWAKLTCCTKKFLNGQNPSEIKQLRGCSQNPVPKEVQKKQDNDHLSV